MTDAGADLAFVLLASHPLFRAAVWVYKVTLVLIFVGGVFGNAMILVLQRRISGGKSSGLSVFVSSLAVSDCAMLLVSGITWYLIAYGTLLPDLHDVLCKAVMWLIFVVGLTSPWILVAMTMQRAASILWPHRVNAAWTAGKAKVTVSVIVAWSLLFNSHILYGRRLRSSLLPPTPPGGQQLCLFASEEYREFFSQVWPSVDMAFSSFIPFALIIASNVVLVKTVRQSMRDARQTLAAGSRDQLKVRESQASGMTLTLVCVSLAFLVLTAPLCVFLLVRRRGGDFSVRVRDVDEAADNFFAEAVGNVLWLSNNAVNFYIYVLTGSRYRAAMASLCGCQRGAQKVTCDVTRSTAVTH